MSAIGPKRTSNMSHLMSLSGVKRTWPIAVQMSAYDPKRTLFEPSKAPALAAIWCDLRAFTGAGVACGSIKNQRGQAERMEIQMATATALKRSVPKQLPPPNSDFYRLADVLTAEKKAIVPAQKRFDEFQSTAHPAARLSVMNRAFYCRARADSCAEAALRRLNLAGFAILMVSAAAVVAQSFAA